MEIVIYGLFNLAPSAQDSQKRANEWPPGGEFVQGQSWEPASELKGYSGEGKTGSEETSALS